MRKFNFDGKLFEYYRIWFLNIFLTVLTLGAYYPKAKAKANKYLLSSINIDNEYFNFNSNIKDTYIQYNLFLFINILLVLSAYLLIKYTLNPLFILLALFSFFIINIYFISFLLYKNSLNFINSISYKDKVFRTNFKFFDFVLITIKAVFVTSLSLGLTAFIALVIFVQTINDIKIITHLLSTDISKNIHTFEIKMIILILIITVILSVFSLIIGFSYYKLRLKSYILKNSLLSKTKFKLKLKLVNYVLLSTTNFIIIFFSLGFATPWVKLRYMKYILNNTKINNL